MTSSQQPLPSLAIPSSVTDEDCNQPSQERQEVLQRLQDAIGDMPPHSWAACHICSLEQLLYLASLTETFPGLVRQVVFQVRTMLATWNRSGVATPQSVSSGPISSPSPDSLQDTNTPPTKRHKSSAITRSKSVRDNAAKRDNNRCVLTGIDIIEVAHIYPLCLLEKEKDIYSKRHMFWYMLGVFWPKEKVATWKAGIFPNGLDEGIDSAINAISLSPVAHYFWNKGSFALKPISVSDDNTTLTIQFFWQARYEQIEPIMSLLNIPPSTRDLEYSIPDHDSLKLRSHSIKSGDLFVIKTDDVQARPLPSIALLEMKWFLQRIMGMAGAADLEGGMEEELAYSDGMISDFELT